MIHEKPLRKILKQTAIIFSLSFFILSCGIDEPTQSTKSLGQQANPDDIQKALDTALSEVDVLTLNKDDYVYYEENYRVELGGIIRQADLLRQLKLIEDLEGEVRYTFHQLLALYNASGNEVVDESESEVVFNIPKSTSPSQLSSMSFQDEDGELPDGCFEEPKESNGIKYDCLRYYNFEFTRGQQSPPQLARERENCSNIPSCQLRTYTLKFEIAKFYKQRLVDREIHHVVLSPDIPFMLPDMGILPSLSYCVSKVLNTDERSYFVNFCTVLRDLYRGLPPSP